MSLPLPLPQILLFIKARRVLRVLVIAGFYGCIAMALAKWTWNGEAVVHMRSYIAFMTILGIMAIVGGFLLRIARCPRCGELFAVRREGRHRNNFTSQCLNCGLRLDGSNAAQAPTE
jgi:hypothetical protein